MAKAKTEPADYAKAMTDFASANAEVAAENMAAFAEVAKKVQMETVELFLAAGKTIQEDAASAVKKAADDVTAAPKKATAAAKGFNDGAAKAVPSVRAARTECARGSGYGR
mgnify:CR=1 FL=1